MSKNGAFAGVTKYNGPRRKYTQQSHDAYTRRPGDREKIKIEYPSLSSKVTKCLNVLDREADISVGLKGGVTIAAKRATELLRLRERNSFHPKTCLYHLGGDGVFGNLDCVFGI